MTAHLVQTTTRDGVRLDGAYQAAAPGSAGLPVDAVCFVHGTGGNFYGSTLFDALGERFLELAGTLGMGMLVRQAVRGVVKFIPVVGSAVGAALAGSSTFALGKAFCYYYSAVHKGHVPKPEDLKRYYKEQLSLAEELWRKGEKAAKG